MLRGELDLSPGTQTHLEHAGNRPLVKFGFKRRSNLQVSLECHDLPIVLREVPNGKQSAIVKGYEGVAVEAFSPSPFATDEHHVRPSDVHVHLIREGGNAAHLH